MESPPYVNHSRPPPPLPNLVNSQFSQFPLQPIPQAVPIRQGSTSPSISARTIPNVPRHSTSIPTPKRRRTSGAGSRGVNSLTPEQLAKKRANDREAQRAIRERTRSQIETLEKRIEDLTAQKPYQELQDVLRQKELLGTENLEIKRRLASIQGLIEPVLGVSHVTQPAAPVNPPNTGSTPIITTNQGPLFKSLPLPPQPYAASSVRSSASPGSGYPGSPSSIKQTPPVPNFPPQPSTFQAVNTFPHQSCTKYLPTRPQDDKLALDFLMQSRHSSRDAQSQRERTNSATTATLPMDPICRTPLKPLSFGVDASGKPLSAWAIPIRNVPPTCPLDNLLLDFLADKRKEAIDGIPSAELIGPPYPSFTSLVHPDRRSYSHPLSKVFTDMLITFPDISTLPEQVAILHMMFLFMRYELSPTPDNYNRLPHWFQPRPTQLTTPHPAWTDYLPWPRMRDTLNQNYGAVPFDDFFIPYTTTVSLNWPYDPATVLLPDKETGELTMDPKFEKHIYDLNNWSLGANFARAHPALAESVRIEDHEPSKVQMGTRVRRRS